MNTRTTLQRHILILVSVIALVAMLVPMSAALAAINVTLLFDNLPVGRRAEQININGMDMASPSSAGAWRVRASNGNFATLSGNVLRNNANCNAPLMVTFDDTQDYLRFRYAVSQSASEITVEGWLGGYANGDLKFTMHLAGTNKGSSIGWREGTGTIDGTPFDTLRIYSPGGCAAIDRLQIS